MVVRSRGDGKIGRWWRDGVVVARSGGGCEIGRWWRDREVVARSGSSGGEIGELLWYWWDSLLAGNQ